MDRKKYIDIARVAEFRLWDTISNVDYELPMKEEYSEFISKFLDDPIYRNRLKNFSKLS